MFVVSLPVIFVNAPASSNRFDYVTPQDIVGFILFGLGLLVETFADIQKFNFRNNPDNRGKWCDKGNCLLISMGILGGLTDRLISILIHWYMGT